ncbi:MAG: transglycosylase domain-containing protein [Armatimonadota bacterium]
MLRRPSFVRKLRKFLLVCNIAALLLCAGGVGLLLGGIAGVRRVLPDTTELSDYRPQLSTLIYSTEPDAEGNLEHTQLGKVYEEERDPIRLKDIPRVIRRATVAIEDRRFYQHQGIDPWGIARALYHNVRGGRVRQGASTITQQLARNIWLTRERTVNRKIKEMLLAIEMERKFSKDEILEMYLNEVNYGHGAYGIATAAKLYYDKDPDELDELTLAQAALLAGLPQRPSTYSPFDHPERARRRRDQVLDAMVRAMYITPAEAAEAKQEQVQGSLAKRRTRGLLSWRAPYFTTHVIKVLSQTYGQEVVQRGGLRVYTSLDMRLQKAAEQALAAGVKRLARQRVDTGALVCMEVRTGRVLAMVGGVGEFREHQWNSATQAKRQPGSAFKPYVYAAALENGWGPRDAISGARVTVPEGYGRTHTFHNYTGGQEHMWSLSSALAASVNCAAVRLQREVGSEHVVRIASRLMDIPSTRLHRYPSLALGTAELSPLEMATGFSAFATAGLRPKRTFVDYIRDSRGELLYRGQPQVERVLHRPSGISMIAMLKGVVRGGTGTRARLSGVPCAGKTGTTQRYRDAWFVGFTPDICTAVWVGRADNGPTARIFGGSAAAPIWKDFMTKAVEILGLKDSQFPTGEGAKGGKRAGPDEREEEEKEPVRLTICAESGAQATRYCPYTREEVFEADEAPTGVCGRHGPAGEPLREPTPLGPSPVPPRATEGVTICTQSGRRATSYCPNTVTRHFAPGTAPGGQCTLHGAAPTPPPPTPPSAGAGEGPGRDLPPEPSGGEPPAPGAEPGVEGLGPD